MKYLKMIGLAAVAAAALMAFAGAGTASAETTLCADTAGASCYGKGTVVDASLVAGTKAVLTPAGFFGSNVECAISTVKGKVETTTTASGKIEQLTFEECTDPVTVTKPGKLAIHHDGEHNGKLTVTGYEVHVEQSSLPCTFAGNITEGITVTGGSMAKVDATATLEGTSSFPCPSSAVWHAEYTVNQPEPLYVVTGV